MNLGIAAATPRGLMVPNIKNAQDLSLKELALALNDLATTARAGKTQPAQMQGGTLTVTNIGALGIDTGTPIINPGEVAIVAFGTIKQKPWVLDGEVIPRWITTLGGSFDHRVVDGECRHALWPTSPPSSRSLPSCWTRVSGRPPGSGGQAKRNPAAGDSAAVL